MKGRGSTCSVASFPAHRKKISNLNQALRQAEFDKVVLSDRILQLQRKLRQMETARDASHGEVIRLRVKLDDLTTKNGKQAGDQQLSLPHNTKLPPDFSILVQFIFVLDSSF